MKGFFVFLSVIATILLFLLARRIHIANRRKTMMSLPPEPYWLKVLNDNIAIYKHLPKDLKEQLYGLMRIFLHEKNFEGCGGLEMTEEIKVTIAAQACILMLNRKPHFYPELDSILVYPSSYFAKDIEPIGSGAYLVTQSNRMGESWKRGIVVLAWDHVKSGAIDLDDGHNVVFHEFAHQLDSEGPKHSANGVPLLSRPSSYITWARVFCREFQKLQRDLITDRERVIDSYGAENPAEFFAVVTESFFEKAVQMKKRHPALYKVLKDYYKLDPANWEGRS